MDPFHNFSSSTSSFQAQPFDGEGYSSEFFALDDAAIISQSAGPSGQNTPVEYGPVGNPVDNYPVSKSTNSEFLCLAPGCHQKPFSRSADLDRHYSQVHVDASQKTVYKCDYVKCPRNSDPFSRKDHFRDHLREYHNEDILRRGVDREWLSKPTFSLSWWRCARCVIRVSIKKHGYACPDCGIQCEKRRQDLRNGT